METRTQFYLGWIQNAFLVKDHYRALRFFEVMSNNILYKFVLAEKRAAGSV